MHLTDALRAVGGLTPMARKSRVELIWFEHSRRHVVFVNVERIVEGELPDPELVPGDQVLVNERIAFF
jgi:hypothetical protein